MQDCETHSERFEVRNYIALMVIVCIILFEAISELKGKITSSCVVAFSWNRQTQLMFLTIEELSALSLLPSHCSNRLVVSLIPRPRTWEEKDSLVSSACACAANSAIVP